MYRGQGASLPFTQVQHWQEPAAHVKRRGGLDALLFACLASALVPALVPAGLRVSCMPRPVHSGASASPQKREKAAPRQQHEGSAASAADEGHADGTQQAAVNEASDDFGWAQGEGSVALGLGVKRADKGRAHHRLLGVCARGGGGQDRKGTESWWCLPGMRRERARAGDWSRQTSGHTRISSSRQAESTAEAKAAGLAAS